MKNFNSQGQAVPDHLWELGLAIRRLIVQRNAIDLWRRRVRGWVMQVRKAAKEPNFAGVDLMYLPLSLESPHIEGKYALLAAVHDECVASPDGEELIHPWALEADFGGSEKVDLNSEALEAIATYVVLMQHVLPQQGVRGIERSNADRLLRILRDVANDVGTAAKLWTFGRSIRADQSVPDPVEEYASFLRRVAETEDVGVDLARPNLQETDLEAAAIDCEQAKRVDEQQVTLDERGKETPDEQATADSEHSAGDGKQDSTRKEYQIRLANWAIAIEDGKTFRLFHRRGQNADWRESGRLTFRRDYSGQYYWFWQTMKAR